MERYLIRGSGLVRNSIFAASRSSFYVRRLVVHHLGGQVNFLGSSVIRFDPFCPFSRGKQLGRPRNKLPGGPNGS